jgi:hypothetical protein
MSMGASPGSDQQDAVKGMMALNDLTYQLNPDLSVVVNRTHKIQFPQTQDYTNNQTTIFIVNSGSDYVDPARSWLSLDVVVPSFVGVPNPKAAGSTAANAVEALPLHNIYMNHYFGPNGSILNLIDSVLVSSRSGDELSRVTNYAQMANMHLPVYFGQDWMDSIGSNLGMSSYIGATNPNADTPNEQGVQRFTIPLYLLSPFFNYGRLMPSAIMSGLRIEIRWKPLDQACQQFFTGAPKFLPTLSEKRVVPQDNQALTEFARFICPNLGVIGGLNAVYPAIAQPANGTITLASTWTYVPSAAYDSFGGPSGGVLFAKNGADLIEVADYVYTEAMVGADSPLLGTRIFVPGQTILLPFDPVFFNAEGKDAPREVFGALSGPMARFTITEVSGSVMGVISNSIQFTERVTDGIFGAPNGFPCGPILVSQIEAAKYEAQPGASIYSSLLTLPDAAVTEYTIKRPHLMLCSVQLTDAIQRVLNEFSSVNGLEIVYSDYDMTTQPFTSFGESNPVYLEIRKSASRALSVMARVVESSPKPYKYDSFASCQYSFWNDYQFQLGSLYFPNQKIEDNNSDADIRRDNVKCLAYNLLLDTANRYAPKAAPTAISLRGKLGDVRSVQYHPVGQHGEHGPSTYLAPRSRFGKWGSYVNGGTTIGTTLERSSAFDLSGVPTNNSRTLAVRGNVGFALPNDATLRANFRATLCAVLQYVRVARVFLLNVEVEQ